MKFPTNSDDIKNEIFISADKYDSLGDLRIRQLIRILSKVDDEMIVEGVIKVFETSSRQNTLMLDQKFGGKILKQLKPKSEVELELLAKRTLGNWNKSVEELPLWFFENYGYEKVKKMFTKIDNPNISEIEKDKLKTMKFWLGLCD